MGLTALTILFLLPILSAAAPDAGAPTSPLLDLLAFVPDRDDIRASFIFYQDFRAVEDSRPYLSRPDDTAAFLSQDIPLSASIGRWLGIPYELASAPLLNVADPSFVAVMGFDFFAINRTLGFGDLPLNAVIWSGDFDLEAVAAAHRARGYIQTAIGGVPAWCGPAGCDSGMTMNMEQRGLPNLFSPFLPRQVPFLIPDERTLISAPALERLEQIADVIGGIGSPTGMRSASLADADDYRVLAQAIADPAQYSGQLVSAIFAPASMTATPPQQNPPDPDAWYLADYGELPRYLNAVIADRQEGEMQVAIIALAYPTTAEAEAGAAELTARLATFNEGLWRRNPNYPPLIDEWDGLAEIRQHVYAPASAEISAAVVEVWYPPAPPEVETAPIDSPLYTDAPYPVIPAAYFNRIKRAIEMGMFYPLWVAIDL
jgi:hypothetical protein